MKRSPFQRDDAAQPPAGPTIHARRMQERRRQLCWTKSDLARAANLPTSLVSQIESGKIRNPRLDTLLALARALEVSLDQLCRSALSAEIPP